MSVQQCMGGWCKRRGVCEHYTAPPTRGMEPVERLCASGQDEPSRFLRADYFKPVELALEAAEQ